ncbi:tripartite tricarboxylate transporter substrate binding protein [Achromobacter denitrificans]|uniref:Bug family tripartite tricarboxylate transporter substrate binding protein n=1 Tax=Achromobacter denitrificans TaxID=32002 RepID=UPI0020962B90
MFRLSPRIAAAFAIACAAVAPMSAALAAFPEKPIRLVVPFPPGGPTDTSARLFSKTMAEQLGQPVIVENRAGAGGSVGTTSVTREQPDGYTLLWGGTSSMVVAPALYPKLDYDPIASFTPIGMAVRGPLILVSRPALPSPDLKALLDLSRRQPLTVASAGTGSVGHLTAELFDRSAGVEILHIPYRGGAPALSDVLGGQVDLLFDTVTLLYPQIAAQKLRAYAVTGAQRYPQLPDVPTVAEVLGKPFEAYSWFGLMAPFNTPQPVIERLTKALGAAARDPEVKRQLADLGLEPVGDTPEQFAQSIRTDLDKWSQVVKQAGIKPD